MALEQFWSESSDWYQSTEEVRYVFNQYQLEIFNLLSKNPLLQEQIVQCQQCQIPFITSIRNRNRKNLRCPMGCRNYTRLKKSKQRSTEYYQSEEGKQKKKHLNQRRAQGRAPPDLSQPAEELSQPQEIKMYLKFLIEWLEQRKLTQAEIEQTYSHFKMILRQHSFVNLRN